MNTLSAADRLHRLMKEALDRGTVASIEEAEACFASYQLVLQIDVAAVENPVHQATLFTAVAIGRRVFLGGVFVHLEADARRQVPLPLAPMLSDAVVQLGGHLAHEALPDSLPRVRIGGKPCARSRAFDVRTLCFGWRGGIVPVGAPEHRDEESHVVTGMLAAGIAVSEAFLYVRAESALAGERAIGLSLWDPRQETDWLTATITEPTLSLLPSRLWLLGLGHLGQAFLWALGLLPYADPAALELVLQDIDIITPSSESTSILSDGSLINRKKTRAMAAWAETRGFSTSIHERLFADGFRRHDDEPSILLCGLDNALGRRALDSSGFDFIVEAGLGRGYQDFRTLRLHTLPASRSAVEIWPLTSEPPAAIVPPAYTKLLRDGVLDRCGMTLLAGKAVGAPFVGAVAATLVIAESLRLLHGGMSLQLLDLDLQWPEHREAVPQRRDFSRLNPGFVRIRPDQTTEGRGIGRKTA
jgi:hypothetical protein